MSNEGLLSSSIESFSNDEISNSSRLNYEQHIITQHDDSNDISTDLSSSESNENSEEDVRTALLPEISVDEAVNLNLSLKECFVVMLGCLLKYENYINKKDDEKLKNQTALVKLILINNCEYFGFDEIKQKGKNLHLWKSFNREQSPLRGFIDKSRLCVVEESSFDKLPMLRPVAKKGTSTDETREGTNYFIGSAGIIEAAFDSILEAKKQLIMKPKPSNAQKNSVKGNRDNTVNQKHSIPVRNVVPTDRRDRVKMEIDKALRNSCDDVNNKSVVKQVEPQKRKSTTHIKKINKKGNIEDNGLSGTSTDESRDGTNDFIGSAGVNFQRNKTQISTRARYEAAFDGVLEAKKKLITKPKPSKAQKNSVKRNPDNTVNKRHSTPVRNVVPMDRRARIKMEIDKALGNSCDEVNNKSVVKQVERQKRKSTTHIKKINKKEVALDGLLEMKKKSRILETKSSNARKNSPKQNPDSTLNRRHSTRVRSDPMDRTIRLQMEIQKALGKSIDDINESLFKPVQPKKRKSTSAINKINKKVKGNTSSTQQESAKRPLYSPDRWLNSIQDNLEC